MSVEVKTPSPSHFEQQRSSFVHQPSLGQSSSSTQQEKQPKKDVFVHPSRNVKKRRASDAAHKFGPPPQKRRSNSYSNHNKGKGKPIVLPTKFLLGGNINDPLNLNSLNDAKVNAAQNAETPKSSPLPTPSHRQQVRVLIPPNINDPLNLNSGEDLDASLLSPMTNNNKRRKKHKKRKSSGDISAAAGAPDNSAKTDSFSTPLKLVIPDDSLSNKMQSLIDKIVSPVIPQTSPKWKRKRTVSEGDKINNSKSLLLTPQLPTGEGKSFKTSPCKPKVKKQQPGPSHGPNYRSKDTKFIHGNYDRYYGKRNPHFDEPDCRLKCFHKDWFDGKDVLDIGCNIGHVTLSVAKDFSPRKIVGMDIDGKLISVARKNIRHYMSAEEMKSGDKRFPISMALTYGPLAGPPFAGGTDHPVFPNNVSFVQVSLLIDSVNCLVA